MCLPQSLPSHTSISQLITMSDQTLIHSLEAYTNVSLLWDGG